MQCTGMSVVRDENHEAIRDYVTRDPLLKRCQGNSVRGLDKCIVHCTKLERQKSMQATFMQRHGKDVADLMFSLDIEMHPMDGLLEAVQICGTMTRMFQLLVSELEESPVIDIVLTPDGLGAQVERPGLYGHDHNNDQAPHVLLNLLQIWMDRYTRACKMALDAGIDERMVRNAESTSGLFLTAFERALRSMPLSDEVKRSLSEAMAREVRTGIAAASNPQILEAATT
jgi:hypothetical protein